MPSVLSEINKWNFSNTFILYTTKDCKENEKEVVCNTSCIHCYYKFANKKNKTYEEMKKEILNMIRKGANHVQITGGEPTIHPDIIKICKFIKEQNLLCSIITNGLMLASETFTNKLSKHIDYFLISFHGGTEKTINKIFQNNTAWNKLNKAIDNLILEKKEIHINYTIMKPNFKELEIAINHLKNKIKRINVITFNPWASLETENLDIAKELMVSYDEISSIINKSYKICKDKKIGFALRYFPFCKLEKNLRKYNFNYTTSIFDLNEWNREMWIPNKFNNLSNLFQISEKLKLEGDFQQRIHHAFCRFYKGFRMHFKEIDACKNCSHILICDQIHREQLKLFKKQKFNPIKGKIIRNAKYYLN